MKTGPEHILEAMDGGLLNAMSDGGAPEKISADLGKVWETSKCKSLHFD